MIQFQTPDKGSNLSIAMGETRGKGDKHMVLTRPRRVSNYFLYSIPSYGSRVPFLPTAVPSEGSRVPYLPRVIPSEGSGLTFLETAVPFLEIVVPLLEILVPYLVTPVPSEASGVRRLDREIDQLMYELYELTAEVIRIVVGNG